MKIITLLEPWAWWISVGWKTIETRTHERFKNLLGKHIGIHGGRKWDYQAIEKARYYLTDSQIKATQSLSVNHKGGLLRCSAFVSYHGRLSENDSQAALIDCSNGDLFGLYLSDIRLFLNPPRLKGNQGIWTHEI